MPLVAEGRRIGKCVSRLALAVFQTCMDNPPKLHMPRLCHSHPSACCSEGALRELPPVASSADYIIPPAELAARRDLRGPEYLVCRQVEQGLWKLLEWGLVSRAWHGCACRAWMACDRHECLHLCA